MQLTIKGIEHTQYNVQSKTLGLSLLHTIETTHALYSQRQFGGCPQYWLKLELFRAHTLGTAELEEPGPFADIDNDEDELEQNKLHCSFRRLLHVAHVHRYSLLVLCSIIV